MTRTFVAGAVALMLTTVACGTRLSHSEVTTAVGPRNTTPGNAALDDTAVTGLDGSSAGPAGITTAGDVPTVSGAKSSSGGSVAGSRAGSAGGATTSGPSSRRAGTFSPVKLASVGTISGPASSSLIGTIEGLQAWRRDVNARGGLNGHLVDLSVIDDGTDPARHRAQIQDQVESAKVVAFIQNNEPATGQGSVAYLTAKRVPVVGSETASSWFYDSPMYFPQASSGRNLLLGGTYSTAQQMLPEGKRKLGTLVCTEAAICGEAERVWNEEGKKVGFDPVYRAKVSLAQPDFTAECLAARSAGVQVLQVSVDTNSVGRLAAACARQGFGPAIASGASVIADRLKDDPHIARLVASSNVFPWFQTDTPATAEFHAAMRRYNPGALLGVGAAQGWVSGKLFEKAAANLPEPPTSEAILRGLWDLKNDTLGGLTQPLTFRENQKPANVVCWFNITVQARRWVSLDRFKLQCR